MNVKPLPERIFGTHWQQAAGWTPETVWKLWRREKFLPLTGIEHRFVQATKCSLHQYAIVHLDWTHTACSCSCIHKEIKSRLKWGNACYNSVKHVLCSSLISKSVKIKIFRAKILSVFCMGVKLGLSHWGRNVSWGCSRIGCWGRFWA
jgi:hypothetical protein